MYGDYIAYDCWLGKVYDLKNQVILKLSNGARYYPSCCRKLSLFAVTVLICVRRAGDSLAFMHMLISHLLVLPSEYTSFTDNIEIHWSPSGKAVVGKAKFFKPSRSVLQNYTTLVFKLCFSSGKVVV